MRIIGLDIARAIAVFGMVIVNFKMVLGSQGQGASKAWMSLLDGKFAALFVILAGVGLALMTRKALQQDTIPLWRKAQIKIAKRALFLFVFGLLYWWIWPADILHFYGLYMLLTLLLLRQSTRRLLGASLGIMFLFPLLLLVFNYEAGWNFATLDYIDFWTVEGFLRNLFFNGFHPVIPWAGFMFFGLWLGRQPLEQKAWLKKAGTWSLGIFIALQAFSYGLPLLFSEAAQEGLNLWLGTAPMPPMPFYLLSGAASSTALITACILWGQASPSSFFLRLLVQTGQLALTLYMAHILLGIVVIETCFDTPLGSYFWHFSLIAALLFNLLSVFFANLWLHFFSSGPFEALMRRICG
ncbi:MAG: DUF418 domain-containing protein [Aureispira sp.]